MKVKDPGHHYLLECLDSKYKVPVWLPFVKRMGPRFPGNTSANEGTTSQEVLRALIDRAKYVNNQIPCTETELSIWLMRVVIFLYEWRAKRIKRKWLSIRGFSSIELEPICPDCAHIRCTEIHP